MSDEALGTFWGLDRKCLILLWVFQCLCLIPPYIQTRQTLKNHLPYFSSPLCKAIGGEGESMYGSACKTKRTSQTLEVLEKPQ